MKKSTLLLFLACVALLPFCTTSRKAMSNKKMPDYSYAKDIAPVMQARCTPCHFPDGGKKKFLDTYAAVTTNIEDIMYRIQLPQDSARFMPWKGKKEPLNDSLILVFKTWKETGMKE